MSKASPDSNSMIDKRNLERLLQWFEWFRLQVIVIIVFASRRVLTFLLMLVLPLFILIFAVLFVRRRSSQQTTVACHATSLLVDSSCNGLDEGLMSRFALAITYTAFKPNELTSLAGRTLDSLLQW